ncbi:MAG: heme-binding domain-containing protein [Crocinitomicaceae bacterium]|nr:heme-binding domain-containing protein [Crocinitomicaceae bacterium]
MKKILKVTLLIVLVIFVGIQFIRIDKTTPVVAPDKDFIVTTAAPDNVASILTGACYDCHSFETKYPWYSQIVPVSWWLKDHIDEGREHLNFSTWGDYSAKEADHKLEECIEEVKEKEMPLNSYTWMHSDAKLTTVQRETLVQFLTSLRKMKTSGDSKLHNDHKKYEEDEEHEEHDDD